VSPSGLGVWRVCAATLADDNPRRRVPASSAKHVASQIALLATSAGENHHAALHTSIPKEISPPTPLTTPAAASVLSFLSLTNYVGIVTVVASSLSAFIEYTAAPQKLGRYNASVLALNVSLNWWASLSDIMKKDRKNVSKLMADCERA